MKVDIFNTEKKYDMIYADPPWKYNARNNNTKFGKGASGHYSLMGMSDIEKLPISKISADNAALFLWVTFPLLDKQIRLFNPGSVGYEGSFGVVNTSGSVLVTSHGKLS